MTTVAMGAEMLLVALSLGTDPSFGAPMAIMVIVGLLSSTFLSLLVIQVILSCLNDAIARFTPILYMSELGLLSPFTLGD